MRHRSGVYFADRQGLFTLRVGTRFMKALLFAFLVIFGGAASSNFVQAQQVPELSGQWASRTLENYNSHFATRTFVFKGNTWRVVYLAYADAQGKQPMFRLDVGGSYVIGEPSESVPGAFEGIFMVDHRRITAMSEDAVHMFSTIGCALEKGRETPLVNTGCGFVPGIMQAMGEYDLVAVKSGALYFGDRSSDLTKARPQKLTMYPLLRNDK